LDQEIGVLNREKNAITHPRSQIPSYATDHKRLTIGLSL